VAEYGGARMAGQQDRSFPTKLSKLGQSGTSPCRPNKRKILVRIRTLENGLKFNQEREHLNLKVAEIRARHGHRGRDVVLGMDCSDRQSCKELGDEAYRSQISLEGA
jgi:hypothetical protein